MRLTIAGCGSNQRADSCRFNVEIEADRISADRNSLPTELFRIPHEPTMGSAPRRVADSPNPLGGLGTGESPCLPPRALPAMPRFLACHCLLLSMTAAFGSKPAAADDRDPAAEFIVSVLPTLTQFCGSCHDPEDNEDPVRFLRCRTPEEVASNRGLWASVAEQLKNRTMPPGDEEQPTEQQRLELTEWIESYLEATACSQGDYAGSPVPRRLNREQYTFAINDLTGEAFDFVETFPADGSGGEGFTNNGETLFLPPLMMERYLEVAQRIVDRVVVSPPFDVTYVVRAVNVDEPEKKRFRFFDRAKAPKAESISLAAGQSSKLLLTVHTDDDFRFALKASHVGDAPTPVALKIDGIAAKRLMIPSAQHAEARWTLLRLSRGIHKIELHVPQDGNPLLIESLRLNQDIGSETEWKQRAASTERILAPGAEWIGKDNTKAARLILQHFARRAWRRPIEERELSSLMSLFQRGVDRGEVLTQAIKLPLKAVLVSPKFLFVAEQGHEGDGIHRVSDLELASRLALFVWNGLPDEELLQLAQKNELHHDSVLLKQVHRMLRDDRSYRFAEAFAGQWLGTVAVGNTVIPDTNHFKPVYTSELVNDLRRQVGETMHWMLRENRPVTEWLDCDYVIVNKRLAKHYGIEPVPPSDEHFQAIDVGETDRPGVLGLGAVHMLTSYSRRTSPVLRGGWVLETIFGTQLPAPPPDVGDLSGGEKEVSNKTVRQRLEKHRENPTCAACHDLIDPIGFALENFDVLGRWRDKEGKNVIDSKGQLPSGETFDGPRELRKVLVNRKEDFTRELSRRMLGFALGRSLEDKDGCAISALTQRLEQDGYRMESLVLGIVQSIPFQYRQEIPAAQDTTANEPSSQVTDKQPNAGEKSANPSLKSE